MAALSNAHIKVGVKAIPERCDLLRLLPVSATRNIIIPQIKTNVPSVVSIPVCEREIKRALTSTHGRKQPITIRTPETSRRLRELESQLVLLSSRCSLSRAGSFSMLYI